MRIFLKKINSAAGLITNAYSVSAEVKKVGKNQTILRSCATLKVKVYFNYLFHPAEFFS